MATASRFPQLALPFAIVGAAAGWLSAGLLANPLLRHTHPGKQGIAAMCAMVFAAAAGALLTRWCSVRKQLAYELDSPSPEARGRGDTWPRHVTVVLLAGTATGTAVAFVGNTFRGPAGGAISGFLCALAFVPVCVAVILAARRALRARLGSIVADSDRRAVWGILAPALALATLEALPDWPAAMGGVIDVPVIALHLAQGAGVLLVGILIVDIVALRRARRALGSGLTLRDPGESGDVDGSVPRLDLGLGDESHARLSRSASAYRGRDRTLALVEGSPEQALSALRRAIVRGAVGIGVVAAVWSAHLAADTPYAYQRYTEHLCGKGDFASCVTAAYLVQPTDVERAILLYDRACHAGEVVGCLALAQIYEGGEGVTADPARVADNHRRACEAGDTASCEQDVVAFGRRWK